MYTRLVSGIKNGSYDFAVFICDDITDLADLPTTTASGISNGNVYNKCAVGSIAKVVNADKKFILNNSGEWIEWVEVASEQSGSGGQDENVTPPSNDWELIFEGHELNVPPASDNIGVCVSNIDVSKYKEFSIDLLCKTTSNSLLMISFSSDNHIIVPGILAYLTDADPADQSVWLAHISNNGKTIVSGCVLIDVERYDYYKENFINNFENPLTFILDEQVNVFPQIEQYFPPEELALDDGVYIKTFADAEINIRIYGRR